MDHRKFRELTEAIYAAVAQLESLFPGRYFTPDGHMVGSLGEWLVADAYGLELMPASNKGFDAKSKSGRNVEIKSTPKKTFALSSEPEHLIAIKILPTGRFEEIYNGHGSLVWAQFKGRKRPKNGQYQICLSKLTKLNEQVDESQRVQKRENRSGGSVALSRKSLRTGFAATLAYATIKNAANPPYEAAVPFRSAPTP